MMTLSSRIARMAVLAGSTGLLVGGTIPAHAQVITPGRDHHLASPFMSRAADWRLSAAPVEGTFSAADFGVTKRYSKNRKRVTLTVRFMPGSPLGQALGFGDHLAGDTISCGVYPRGGARINPYSTSVVLHNGTYADDGNGGYIYTPPDPAVPIECAFNLNLRSAGKRPSAEVLLSGWPNSEFSTRVRL